MDMPPPESFTTRIDNPRFILRPGTTFVFENREEGSSKTVEVTRETRVVNGVTCVVVHDIARQNGQINEDTYDWYAQDADGNVWYFGEATQDFEPGNPDPVSTGGSWEAGVDGAEAGIIMLANPQEGDAYAQENAPGIAEDRAVVLDTDTGVAVVYGAFDGALQTRDINPLDPSRENKFYVPGVGEVLTIESDGAREELVAILVNGTRGDDDLLGYAGGDQMRGGRGGDQMRGAAGNDSIDGSRDNDDLYGGAGHDRITGGAGDDDMSGGGGSDTFVFRSHANGTVETDEIDDYSRGDVDVIDLGGATVVDEAFFGGVWTLTLSGDGDRIRLEGLADTNADGSILDELLFA